MEKKVVKKMTATTRSKKKKEISADPFETLADTATPVKKPAARKAKTRKTVKAPVEIAETAVATSPVKKARTKTVRAKKVTPAAMPKLDAKADTIEAQAAVVEETAVAVDAQDVAELSPAFKVLSEPVLPTLARVDRARLQMQTPTRLYFYWSVKEDPWTRLRDVFGDDLGSYTLVLKLSDLTRETDEIHRCEREGSWWFNVEPGTAYRAEIGFFAPNRPYFRVVYSNTVETPRRSPSPHRASEAVWTVSSTKFAEVLDASGFGQDALDVAFAGDDPIVADNAAQIAFSRFVDVGQYELDGISAAEIRYAMTAIASGATLEELRFSVSASLFKILQSNAANTSADRALSALDEHFEIDEADLTSERFGPVVFGASLINFPTALRRRVRRPAGHQPVSSHTFRR